MGFGLFLGRRMCASNAVTLLKTWSQWVQMQTSWPVQVMVRPSRVW